MEIDQQSVIEQVSPGTVAEVDNKWYVRYKIDHILNHLPISYFL
jgi:hypothetical protein